MKTHPRTRKILTKAGQTGGKASRVLGMEPNLGEADFRVYNHRQWLNPINNLSSRRTPRGRSASRNRIFTETPRVVISENLRKATSSEVF